MNKMLSHFQEAELEWLLAFSKLILNQRPP